MTDGFFAESNLSGFFGSYNPEKQPNQVADLLVP
jgi:hypothetical protein